MLDKNTCWYQASCVDEMNRFYDANRYNAETSKHFSAFTYLLTLADEKKSEILDLGCGSGMLSEYCKQNVYIGADLPHILSGCAMRNYPGKFYRSCDIVNDDLSWIRHYPVVAVNAVIDIMQHPLEMLGKLLESSGKYVILHRQEITELGETRSVLNPSYGGYTYHSIISRQDFNNLLEAHNFDVVKEVPLEFGNWENGGCSFLLRKRRSWSLYHIDHALNKLFREVKNGFFIEAGANDGLSQSNSMYFEFYKNWKGILVEPIEELYERCLQNRSVNTIVEHAALVASDFKGSTIDIMYTPGCNGLMSVVEGTHSAHHLGKAQEAGIKKTVPAKTLNHILEKHGVEKINILMLDIEGYELEALKGIDFDKYQIDYLLVEELYTGTLVEQYLSPWYTKVDKLTEHDYLYKRK